MSWFDIVNERHPFDVKQEMSLRGKGGSLKNMNKEEEKEESHSLEVEKVLDMMDLSQRGVEKFYADKHESYQ